LDLLSTGRGREAAVLEASQDREVCFIHHRPHDRLQLSITDSTHIPQVEHVEVGAESQPLLHCALHLLHTTGYTQALQPDTQRVGRGGGSSTQSSEYTGQPPATHRVIGSVRVQPWHEDGGATTCDSCRGGVTMRRKMCEVERQPRLMEIELNERQVRQVVETVSGQVEADQ
jgi:hypothetical protein